jgi:hypothetical protein
VPSLPQVAPAVSQLAVYAPGTTHVWRGATSDKWDDVSNWFPAPPSSLATLPTTTSQVLVPSWPAPYAAPKLTSATTQIDKLWVQNGGVLDMSGQVMIVGNGGVIAPAAFLNNGTMKMYGTGALDGHFDRLSIGDVGPFCSGVNASLRLVTLNALDVYCQTAVDATASAKTLAVYAGGALTISTGALLSVSGNAQVSGGALNIDGTFSAASTLTLLDNSRLTVNGVLNGSCSGGSNPGVVVSGLGQILGQIVGTSSCKP